MRKRLVIKSISALLVAIVAIISGCAKSGGDRPMDVKSGVVNTNVQADLSALKPIDISLDSKQQLYFMYDHLAFLSDNDSVKYAMTVTFGRGLNNNSLVRAERDFFGFVFDGKYWQALPYMKMKHDSTRLTASYPYLFGGLSWNDQHDGGEVSYDWRETKADLKFSDLKSVQSLRVGDTRLRSHAIGRGTLYWKNDTIPGTVFYELYQVDGLNPVGQNQNGVAYLNNDWIAARTISNKLLIANTDTVEATNKIMKNFVAISDAGVVEYADGSDHVHTSSDGFKRDYNIFDWIATNKHLSAAELSLTADLGITDSRIFYSDGYCVGIVQGTVSVNKKGERASGLIEHRQKPKSQQEVLK